MRLSSLSLLLLGCLDPADPQFNVIPQAPFHVTDSHPMDGEREVPTDSVIDVGLSDVPWPADLPAAWDLHTGTLHTIGLVSADLVDRRVRVRAARGMLPNVQYTLTLSDRLHSFAGAALEPKQIQFITARSAGATSPPPPVRSLRSDVLPALAPCSGCHSGDTPAQQLDLATATGVLVAIGRPSLVTGNVLITPGSHPGSYLVWKALGLPRTLGHQADSVPPLAHDAARVLADWIDEGAADD